MKKIIIVGTIILALGFIYFNTRTLSPMFATVQVDGKAAAVTHGTYCWQSFGRAECIDMASPYAMAPVPLAVERGATIMLRYAEEPAEIGINIWWTDDDVETIARSTTWTAPLEPGLYIYEAFARWPGKGDTSTVFQLHVQ